MSVMLMTSSIGGITAPLTAAARAAGAATIFYTVLDAPRPDTGGLRAPDVVANEDIVLDHVNFAYPTRPHIKVLDDLSVRFPAGKITAIVGPSGSGKSTIVALLERWYELDGDPAEKQIVSLAVLQIRRISWNPGLIKLPGKDALAAKRRHHHRGTSAQGHRPQVVEIPDRPGAAGAISVQRQHL